MCSIASGQFTEALFPVSTSLANHLISRGVDSLTAEKLSSVYLKGVHSLKQRMEFEYSQACDSILSTGPGAGNLACKLLSVLSLRYKQTLAMWSTEVLKKAHLRSPNSTRSDKPLSKPKNRASIPKPVIAITRPNSCVLVTSERPQYSFPCAYPPPVKPSPLPQIPLERLSPLNHKLDPTTRPTSTSVEELITSFGSLSLHSVQTTPRKTPAVQASVTPRKVALAPAVAKVTVSSTSHTPSPNPPLDHSPATGQIKSRAEKVRVLPHRRPSTRPISIPRSNPRIKPYDSSPESSYGGRTPSLTSDSGSEAGSPPTPTSSRLRVLPPPFPHKRVDHLPPTYVYPESPGVIWAIQPNNR